MRSHGATSGQAAVLIVGVLCGLLVGTFALGAMARGIGVRADAQRAADLGAVAGARALLEAYPRLFESGPRGMTKAEYLSGGRAIALDVVRRNGGGRVAVSFPDAATFAPVRIRVRVAREVVVRRGDDRAATTVTGSAEAELAPGAGEGPSAFATGGGYDGPLAHRQGKPMRPDVALAFDRLSAAARADGHTLLITSGYRSDAEQAILWARNPDPRWVARPGHSLHRNGTELDLGPRSAYAWLAANAGRFHFVLRYGWEPWHFGLSMNPRSAPRGGGGGGGERSAVPSFVPERHVPAVARAAQRWNVSATLLAAQLHAESGFNPLARSPAGARGIAQFMPATARAYGLDDPFDAPSAIDAQARMMRDLLRRFGTVPLALAAYNAGPARVAACACVPPIAETRGYVARILGLMGGAGEVGAAGGGGLSVRLVR
jgi:hypothetical protein